jgi:FkbM family methyltransferase
MIKEFEWEERNYFKPTFDFLSNILKKTNPKILEIGAHWGQDTVRFCKTFPNLNIYCFEPLEDNFFILNKVTTKIPQIVSEFEGNIFLYKKAICEKDNKKQIFYRPIRTEEKTQELKKRKNPKDPYHNMKLNGWIAGNLYLDTEDIKNQYFDADGCSLQKIFNFSIPVKEEIVETLSLDAWDKEMDVSLYDLAWIDVQGAEGRVIDGATNTLKKVNYVYIEHSQKNYESSLSRIETINKIKNNGFNHFIDVDGDNLLFGKTPGWK